MRKPLAPAAAVETALASSTADATVVLASVTASANIRWANNTLTTNGVTTSVEISVISIDTATSPRAASLSATAIDTDALAGLVRASNVATRDTPPAEDAAPLVTGGAADDFAEAPGDVAIGDLRAVADALAAAFDTARARGEGRYGFAEHSVTTTYLGSSTGVRLRDVQQDNRLELTGRTPDGSRSAWSGMSIGDVQSLDVAALEADVAQRLDWSSRRHELAPGRYETILPPAAVADLLIEAYWSMGALDAHEGSTVYSRPGGGTRVGDRLSDLPLALYSDPAMPGRECTPFAATAASSRLSSVFDNGLPLARTDWIEDGTLRALLQTRHSAEVTGLPVTPFVDNLALVVPGATDSLSDVVASTKRGLLLSCLWYIREVDPQSLLLTGLTRDGVFLIENGEVAGAVTNFRFNDSPISMLHRITGASRTEDAFGREFGDYFTRCRTPTLRIADFNMSTVSQAS